MTTIDKFIKRLQAISEDKRKLPLVINCPNGIQVDPVIKLQFKKDTFMTESAEIEKMVITYD